MKIWKEGDHSRGICPRCKRSVETRFERRSVELEQPKVAVPDVLVSVCAECGETIAVPHQSAPRLREARRREVERYEARIPQELTDVLWLVADKFDARVEHFGGGVIRLYLFKVSRDPKAAQRIKQFAGQPLARGKSSGRISVRLEKPAWAEVWEKAQRAGFANRSEIIRGVLLAAAVDAGVATVAGLRPSRDCEREMRAIAVATATL